MRLQLLLFWVTCNLFLPPHALSLATSDPPNCPYLSPQILLPANWQNQQNLLPNPKSPKICQLNVNSRIHPFDICHLELAKLAAKIGWGDISTAESGSIREGEQRAVKSVHIWPNQQLSRGQISSCQFAAFSAGDQNIWGNQKVITWTEIVQQVI